jgi:Arc/MetJ family transcription regulator
MHVRTTLDLDEHLLEEARRLTGIDGKTALIHSGLQELIRRESARMLIALGGTAPNLKPIKRRRALPAKAWARH